MTNPVGRPPGGPKYGGRKKGSLDKNERLLINSEIAHDILATYRKLGGPKFLLAWAQENPTEFIRQCWARLAPAFPKDGADIQVTSNTQFNIDSLGQPGMPAELEAARRIAFALSLGLQAAEPDADAIAVESCRVPEPNRYSQPEPAEQPSQPLEGPEYDAWVESLGMPPEQRADAALARQPHLNLREQGRSLLPEAGDPPERQRRGGIPKNLKR